MMKAAPNGARVFNPCVFDNHGLQAHAPLKRKIGMDGAMQWHPLDIEYAVFVLGTIPGNVIV